MRCMPALLCLCLLAACVAPEAPPKPEQLDLQSEVLLQTPKARAGECFARERQPALYESIIEQSRRGRAQYATKAEQRLLRAPREIWFATPCPAEMTPALIASLQRALMARGLYRGEVNGVMTAQTGAALHAYQSQAGLGSHKLALATARHLGLLVSR